MIHLGIGSKAFTRWERACIRAWPSDEECKGEPYHCERIVTKPQGEKNCWYPKDAHENPDAFWYGKTCDEFDPGPPCRCYEHAPELYADEESLRNRWIWLMAAATEASGTTWLSWITWHVYAVIEWFRMVKVEAE